MGSREVDMILFRLPRPKPASSLPPSGESFGGITREQSDGPVADMASGGLLSYWTVVAIESRWASATRAQVSKLKGAALGRAG